MSIASENWGQSFDGAAAHRYTLSNGKIAATVSDYGCTLLSLAINGTDICLGYDTVGEYMQNDGYIGAVVGRCANRIGGGRFTLNGKQYELAKNNGANHLHGGMRGFDKYVWQTVNAGDSFAEFHRVSPDGEEGYPGNLDVTVRYTLTDNSLCISYFAETDADTVLNLTNHAYFNLNGHEAGGAMDNLLTLNADSFTENGADVLPTGKILSVEGTPMDFRTAKPIGRDIDADCVQLHNCGGYDHNFVLRDNYYPAAVVRGPKTGIEMSIYTTMPGVQLYSANFLTDRAGKNGARYGKRSGFCLETQFFPNCLACSAFKPAILRRDEAYAHKTEYVFNV